MNLVGNMMTSLLGAVYMTPGRLSRSGEFTPVPSHGNLVPRASFTFVQRMGQRTLWKNPKPEPQNPGSGLTAPA